MEKYNSNYKELKELCERDLKERNVKLEELNKFDLKLEMQNNQQIKNISKEKAEECIKDIIDICKLDFKYEDIFDASHIYERYLLFKIQYQLLPYNTYKFDCDKTDEVYHFYEIDDNESTDTLLSLQSYLTVIFKQVDMKRVLFNEDAEIYKELMIKYDQTKVRNARKFISQLINLEDVKKELGDLYNTILKFVIYYHTIGNMAPCPGGSYNKIKGEYLKNFQETHRYDRLDLFRKKEPDIFKEFEVWFTEEKIEKYCLEKVYEGFEMFPEKESNETKEQYLKKVNDYLNIVIDIIKERNINVIDKYIK